MNFDDVVNARHSSRMFLPNRHVPDELLREALTLARRAPSNSNVQPWHVVFASGPARDRLVEALMEEAQAASPNVPQLPDARTAR